MVTLALCSGCAMPVARPLGFFRTDPGPADQQADMAKCDYEISLTVRPDPGFRTILVQELEMSQRRNELMKKCMIARGWSPM